MPEWVWWIVYLVQPELIFIGNFGWLGEDAQAVAQILMHVATLAAIIVLVTAIALVAVYLALGRS